MVALMFQGTGSSVGKSLLVAGLARALMRRGMSVRPFKPQNMSNNAAVTADGGEIGRAQALQAYASGVPASVHMNPVLLKPQSDTGSQIIVQGKVYGVAAARAYQMLKPELMPYVLESFGRMSAEADIVLVEGAGSASEINLRADDIANMGFARATRTPVVVIGDIDRGGVIASLVGTWAVVEEGDRALVAGYVVNRMRGDLTLFAEGLAAITRHTDWPALGLIPFFEGADRLPAEDSMDLLHRVPPRRPSATRRIAVPILPRIANFDDLDPLLAEPSVEVVMVRRGAPLPCCDLVILPGSKATIADLEDFRGAGWDIDLAAHVRRGGRVLGICGGYQMLGQRISDPDGIEGPPAEVPGLGLLDVMTTLRGTKALREVSGRRITDNAPFRGYEMHMGQTVGPDTNQPVFALANGRVDGAVSPSGLVEGSYIHGMFVDDSQRGAFLRSLGVAPAERNHDVEIEATLDALARHLERHMDIDRLLSLAR